MQIHVNGNPMELEDSAPLAALIEHLGLVGRRIAVEVNAELVPRSRFEAHALRAGDCVEIIHAVGGG
ncbi:MAG: sulfur carrier protein ThiS [Bdellovibrio bacteriovorus]